MTDDVAIEILNRIINDGKMDSVRSELAIVASNALRKQIPTKPTRTEDEFKTCYKYRCPVCGYYFGTKGKHSVVLFDMPQYCDCGQAIDWSEE